VSWYAEALSGWHGEEIMNELQRRRLSMPGTPSWPLNAEQKELALRPGAYGIAEVLLATFDNNFWLERGLIPSWTLIDQRRPLLDRMVELNVLRKRPNKSGTGTYYVPTPYTRPWAYHALDRKSDVPDPQ
jgi:hypothetical protein